MSPHLDQARTKVNPQMCHPHKCAALQKCATPTPMSTTALPLPNWCVTPNRYTTPLASLKCHTLSDVPPLLKCNPPLDVSPLRLKCHPHCSHKAGNDLLNWTLWPNILLVSFLLFTKHFKEVWFASSEFTLSKCCTVTSNGCSTRATESMVGRNWLTWQVNLKKCSNAAYVGIQRTWNIAVNFVFIAAGYENIVRCGWSLKLKDLMNFLSPFVEQRLNKGAVSFYLSQN